MKNLTISTTKTIESELQFKLKMGIITMSEYCRYIEQLSFEQKN